MTSTLVYYVRHGQTAENRQGMIQGQLDTQLDEVGIEQAAAVAQSLKDVQFDAAFSSDLERAVDTANAILTHHPGLPLHKMSILRERFMGNLQGQLPLANGKRRPQDETVETGDAFRERILEFWDQTVIPYAKKAASEGDGNRPACLLVVSHGAYIGTLARALTRHRNIVNSAEIAISWCPNTSVTVIEVRGDGTGILRSFGDISHLVKPAAVGNADDLSGMDAVNAR
ncbi:phosphoglycerate mutase-like protein [Gautieria morchelliformis]|nr:phosphoglycerate mutase-like protein [Gautieria morchelliformis]